MGDLVPRVLQEVLAGDSQSLPQAAKQFQGHRGNRHLTPSAVFRWRVKGVRTQSGCRVKLEAVRVGSRWMTSRAAVARFIVALTEASEPSAAPPEPPRRTESARDRACERAVAELKARGA